MTIKSLIKDIFVYGAGNLVFKAISFFVFPLYTYVLTVSDFGAMELVNTGVGIVALIINLGLNNSVQRFYYDKDTGTKEQPLVVSNGLYCMSVFGCIVALAAIVFVYLLQDFLSCEYSVSWTWVVIALINVYISQHISYCMDVMRLHFLSKRFALISSGCSLLTVVFCLLFLFYFHYGVLGFFLASLLASVLMFPISIWSIKKDLVALMDFKWCIKLLQYGYPMVFSSIFYWALSTVDRWMLAMYKDVYEIGLYSIGFKFASIIIFINNAVVQAWIPFCMKMFSEDENYKRKIADIYSCYICVLVFLGTIISLFSKEILMFLLPTEYHNAASTLSILVIGTVIYSSTQFSVIGMTFEQKTKYIAYVSFLTLIVNILLNFLFIPIYGSAGASVAMLLSYLIMTILYFFITSRIHYIPYSKYINCYCLFILVFSSICGNMIIQEGCSMFSTIVKFIVLWSLFFPVMVIYRKKFRILLTYFLGGRGTV